MNKRAIEIIIGLVFIGAIPVGTFCMLVSDLGFAGAVELAKVMLTIISVPLLVVAGLYFLTPKDQRRM